MKKIKVDDVDSKPIKETTNLFERPCRVYELGEDKVFKMFGIQNYGKYKGLLLEKFTVKKIHEYRDLLKKLVPEIILPEDYITIDGIIKGYTMKRIKGVDLKDYLESDENSLDDKIKYLEEIGNILDKMENFRKETKIEEFFINDLHVGNFLVGEDKKLYVMDVSDFKIEDNITSPAKVLFVDREYLNKENDSGMLDNNKKYTYEYYTDEMEYSLPNKNTDMYGYYIIILNFLLGLECIEGITTTKFNEKLDILEKVGLDPRLLKIFRNIMEEEENINPKHLVKYIKDVFHKIKREKESLF